MTRSGAGRIGFGILGLSIGYFLWYAPYAGLTKALSSGLLPGMDQRVGGLVLLPATALGALTGCAVFLAVSGWWRHAFGRAAVLVPGAGRSGAGRSGAVSSGAPPASGVRPAAPWRRRTMVAAGFFTALIIATTTLNYTFAGVSILFMLVMMRGGVLILSPVIDAVRRRRVLAHSWAALLLSLLAVAAMLSDVDNYHLTAAAVLSLATYLVGYSGRFEIMSRIAKTGDVRTGRRYLVEEQIAAVVWQVLLCGLLALLGPASMAAALREGFTGFLLSPAVVPAFGVGLLYSGLFVYGTLIYLDPREYTWCVPVNRCASLLSGVVASYALAWFAGLAAPARGQLVATVLIGLAALSLSYPSARSVLAGRRAPAPRQLLFICGGNTGRSAMAEAIARYEIARAAIPAATLPKTSTPGAGLSGAELSNAGLSNAGLSNAGLSSAGKAKDAPAGAGLSNPGISKGAAAKVRMVKPPKDKADAGGVRWTAYSAGLSARSPGLPMAAPAVAALRELGVPAHRHRSRQLTWEICRGSTIVYCMTRAQRAAVAELVPEMREYIFCLDPNQDIPDPATAPDPVASYRQVAEMIRHRVRARVEEHLVHSGAP